MHTRLMVGFVLRLPLLLWRRVRRLPAVPALRRGSRRSVAMPTHVRPQRAPVGAFAVAGKDDAALAHHHDAVRQRQQLVQVFADQQHRAAAVAHGRAGGRGSP
jgi:hypothetical protein